MSITNKRRAEMVSYQLLQKGIQPTEILNILQEDFGFSSEVIQDLPFYPKGFKDTTNKAVNPGNALDGINNAFNDNVVGETRAPNSFPQPTMNYAPPGGPPKEQKFVESKHEGMPNEKLAQNRADYLFNTMNTLDKPIPEFNDLAREIILGSDTTIG